MSTDPSAAEIETPNLASEFGILVQFKTLGTGIQNGALLAGWFAEKRPGPGNEKYLSVDLSVITMTPDALA